MAIDFASEVAASGQRLRIFSVVDSFTRECLALEVDTSMPSRRITRALGQVIAARDRPVSIRSDNGPEMSSRHYLAWCIEYKIDAVHSQPGKPTQNAHVESFHDRLRDECLNTSWFWNLIDARCKIEAWRTEFAALRAARQSSAGPEEGISNADPFLQTSIPAEPNAPGGLM